MPPATRLGAHASAREMGAGGGRGGRDARGEGGAGWGGAGGAGGARTCTAGSWPALAASTRAFDWRHSVAVSSSKSCGGGGGSAEKVCVAARGHSTHSTHSTHAQHARRTQHAQHARCACAWTSPTCSPCATATRLAEFWVPHWVTSSRSVSGHGCCRASPLPRRMLIAQKACISERCAARPRRSAFLGR